MSPFLPFHLQEVQSAATASQSFPIFSFIPTAAPPGWSLWTSPTHLETQSQRGRAQKKFFPKPGVHSQPPSFKPVPALLSTSRIWMNITFVDREVIFRSDKTGEQMCGSSHISCSVRSQGADFLKAALYCNCHSFSRSLLSWKVKHFLVVDCIQ